MFWRQTAWCDHRIEPGRINQGRDDASTVGNVVAAKWLQEAVQAGSQHSMAFGGPDRKRQEAQHVMLRGRRREGVRE